MIHWLWVWSVLLAPIASGAELRLDEVLAALDTRLPVLAEAAAKQQEAAGKALSTRGAFDPKLASKGKLYADDPYDRTLMEGYLSVRTPVGASMEGGWRYGVGEFPSYDGLYTKGQGEVFLGGAIPVLDGLLYGPERVVRDVADAELLLRTAELDLKRVEVRRKAAESYWKWVAAGQALSVEQSILELATQRAEMLRRQQQEGSRSTFDVLDNERVLFQRRGAVIAAKQKLRLAAVELSLWWRQAQGTPQIPDHDQLPTRWPDLPAGSSLSEDLKRSQARPDVAAVQALLRAVDARQRRAHNALLPDLLARGEMNRDLESDKVEFIGQLELSSSLLLRKERGTLDAVMAERRRVEARLQGVRDRVRADVLAAHAVRDLATQRVEVAGQAADRATRVLEMERRRAELGGVTLFQLLLREGNLEKARKSLVDSELELRLAEAAVGAAVGIGP